MSGEIASPPQAKGRGRPPVVRNFYGDVLRAAERLKLAEAAALEGLNEEIDVLRTKLRQAVEGTSPEDFKLMLRGMDILVRMVSTHYRMSEKSQADLAASISAMIDRFREEFYMGQEDGS